MNGQVTDIFGIYLPTFGLIMLATFLILLPLRWLLARAGVFGWFWHRGLVELALMTLISAALLYLVVSHDGLSL